MKLERLVAHWDKKTSPSPIVYYFKTFQSDNGVAEVYEEKDHSSKLAQGKLNSDLVRSKKTSEKQGKLIKKSKDHPKPTKRTPGRPRKE